MKTNLYSLLFCFFITSSIVAQLQYKGFVKDAKTKQPLSYVNIGVIKKEVGTVTDEDGRFFIAIDRNTIALTDTLQISSVGYKTIRKAIGDINFSPRKKAVVLMEPDVFALEEVVLSAGSEEIRQRKVGYYFGKTNKVGYWRGITSLGAEMVTKIKVNRRPRQLNEFSFHVLANAADSLLLRVNVYKGDTEFPAEKLTTKNMIFTLKKKKGKVIFDLTPYELYVTDDFSIGLELLDVYGKRVNLTLAASDDPGTSYRRYASQGEWKRFRNDALIFYVNTTIFAKDDLIAGTEDAEFSSRTVRSDLPEEVSGIVFNNGRPLPNADVKVEGKNITAKTDENGRYQIKAEMGDVLTFGFLDMETVSRTVLETTFGINVSMRVKVNELENVTVTERKKLKKTQTEMFAEYNTNPDLIKTAFGIFDKETSGIDLYILDEGEFSASAINILQAVRGKFPGVRISSKDDPLSRRNPNDTGAVLFMRGVGSILNPVPIIYEIDGVVHEEVPFQLNMDNVKRMALLPGLAATSRYGSIASGGMLVINTKTFNVSPKKGEKNVDALQVKNNFYKDDAISQSQVQRNWPNYLQELNISKTYEEAVEVYEKYEDQFSGSAFFYTDSYNYFKENWSEETEMDTAIMERSAVFGDDTPALIGLAYAYEKAGELQRAQLIYKKIFRLRPNHAQSYLDLARNYVQLGSYAKALNLYSRYNYLLNQQFLEASEQGPHAIIRTEFNNLVKQHGKQLVTESEAPLETDPEAPTGTRIVLDWNDPSADFELQFVNPRNRYFNWRSLDAEERKNNAEQVYSKEYFIDDYMKGDWSVNINYKGGATLGPVYLKATIFFNYGTPAERSTIRVYRLSLKNVNQELFKLTGNPMTATR